MQRGHDTDIETEARVCGQLGASEERACLDDVAEFREEIVVHHFGRVDSSREEYEGASLVEGQDECGGVEDCSIWVDGGVEYGCERFIEGGELGEEPGVFAGDGAWIIG